MFTILLSDITLSIKSFRRITDNFVTGDYDFIFYCLNLRYKIAGFYYRKEIAKQWLPIFWKKQFSFWK